MVAIEIYLPVLLMILLLILGVPVIAWLGLGTVLLLQFTGILPMALVGETIFSGLNSFPLIAVPLFILTGDALAGTGLSEKLLVFAESVFAGIKSALGTATLFGCGLFAAISGSNASAAAAVGRMTIDYLDDTGYDRSYASALVASGASTGILIPPSIAYIIAGVALGESASTLFLAALIPGVLILFGLIATNVFINRQREYESASGHPSIKKVGDATWEAKYALLIPFIILGGIYSGVFTPSEAASIAVLITIFIGLNIKTLDLSDFPAMFERSALVNGVISPIIAIAILFSQVLSALNIPQQIVIYLTSLTTNFYILVVIMMIIFMFAGAVMETTPNILILGPLMMPVAKRIGMDPVHFIVFMISALAIGFMTPPIGLNLYVMAGISGEPISKIARRAIPFIVSMVLIVLLIGMFSPISMVFV